MAHSGIWCKIPGLFVWLSFLKFYDIDCFFVHIIGGGGCVKVKMSLSREYRSGNLKKNKKQNETKSRCSEGGGECMILVLRVRVKTCDRQDSSGTTLSLHMNMNSYAIHASSLDDKGMTLNVKGSKAY